MSFGYNNRVSDMRSLAIMRDTGCPVVSMPRILVQLPGGSAPSARAPVRALIRRAVVAAGVSGVFMETHPTPDTGVLRWPQRVAAAAA